MLDDQSQLERETAYWHSHEARRAEFAAALIEPAGADGISKGAKNFE